MIQHNYYIYNLYSSYLFFSRLRSHYFVKMLILSIHSLSPFFSKHRWRYLPKLHILFVMMNWRSCCFVATLFKLMPSSNFCLSSLYRLHIVWYYNFVFCFPYWGVYLRKNIDVFYVSYCIYNYVLTVISNNSLGYHPFVKC